MLRWKRMKWEILGHKRSEGGAQWERGCPPRAPALRHGAAGQTMDGDPYIIDGWSRKVVKIAFNVLVNATGPTAAVQAIVWEARKRERRARREGAAPPAIVREILGPKPYRRAHDLVACIRHKHA